MAADLIQAQTSLFNHILKYVDSMSLKCAVQLGIPGILHKHNQPISLLELAEALQLPPNKHSFLRRLMRVLSHSGVFSVQRKLGDEGEEEEVYLLTPLSRLLVTEEAGISLSPFLLAILDPITVAPLQFMASWFRSSDVPTPFAAAHGCGFWDKANENPEFNKTFNDGLGSDAGFLLDIIVKDAGHVFEGLSSLVDVGGGTGAAMRAIFEAFPEVKCSVLDLAHVVEAAPKDGRVTFIAGDMFQYVPPAQAVFMKSTLHDWGDEDCVKILQRCKEAIPRREDGGKVIILDLVVGSVNSHPKAKETQIYWDMLMLVLVGGAEREEHEWRKIFNAAGFTDYKITPALGMRSVIELYP